MKCDELKYEKLGDMMPFYPRSTLVIRKQFVDTAITELKARIHELESMPHTDNSDVIERISNENERLKAKLEDVQATAYTESVDAGMENRKLKRALWLARAERAVAEQTVDEWSRYKEKHPFGSWRADPFEYWMQAWICVEKICRKKAEEYK